MNKHVGLMLLCLTLAGCASSPGEVTGKVLQDFGLRARPEGYVSGTDRVFERLNNIGKSEMKRLNMQGRHGKVMFEGEGSLRGKYYKEVKIYENYYPLDARPASRTATGDRGYIGFIEYAYRMHQSARKSNRTEAAAERATIPVDERGRETYRYKFNSGGYWNGGDGERTKK